MRRAADLTPLEFRHALIDHGFAYLGRSVDRYVDLHHPRPGHYLGPVLDKHKRTLRRQTLKALLADRARSAELARQEDASHARQVALAAAIAPSALAPARAGLTDADAIAQLADDFVALTTRNEGALIDELVLMGWDRAQLKQHAPAARIVAYRRQDGVLA